MPATSNHTPLDGFRRLAVTHAASLGGDTLIAVALAGSIFFNVSADAARPKVLLYLAVTMVPFAVVSPVIGPALDRTRGGRRLVLAVSAGGRALLCLLMADHISSLYFYPEAFGALALSKAHVVGKAALVPAVVPDETVLVEANSRLALVGVLAGIVLAPLAAGAQALVGAPWVLRGGAFVFVAASVSAMRIPQAKRVAAPAGPVEQAELRVASILLASTSMAVLRAAIGFLTFAAGFVFKRSRESSWVFGAAIAAGAAGGLVGALAAPRLRRFVREEVILVGSLLVPAAVALLAARDFSREGVFLVAGAVGAGASAGRLAFDSLVQRDAPDAARGRTFARFETRFQLVWVAGAFVPVVVPIPGTLGFVMLGAGLGVSGLTYLAGVRAARAAPRSGPA
ncbi:MAG: MFS transporter [Acidimicrobiia bacterium]